jgi:hypothetical protein
MPGSFLPGHERDGVARQYKTDGACSGAMFEGVCGAEFEPFAAAGYVLFLRRGEVGFGCVWWWLRDEEEVDWWVSLDALVGKGLDLFCAWSEWISDEVLDCLPCTAVVMVRKMSGFILNTFVGSKESRTFAAWICCRQHSSHSAPYIPTLGNIAISKTEN